MVSFQTPRYNYTSSTIPQLRTKESVDLQTNIPWTTSIFIFNSWLPTVPYPTNHYINFPQNPSFYKNIRATQTHREMNRVTWNEIRVTWKITNPTVPATRFNKNGTEGILETQRARLDPRNSITRARRRRRIARSVRIVEAPLYLKIPRLDFMIADPDNSAVTFSRYAVGSKHRLIDLFSGVTERGFEGRVRGSADKGQVSRAAGKLFVLSSRGGRNKLTDTVADAGRGGGEKSSRCNVEFT